jgi:hypothetical protein
MARTGGSPGSKGISAFLVEKVPHSSSRSLHTLPEPSLALASPHVMLHDFLSAPESSQGCRGLFRMHAKG